MLLLLNPRSDYCSHIIHPACNFGAGGLPNYPLEEKMKRVSISELKAKLSEYLEAVRAGEEVIVTDRGRPVARIGPVTGSADMESRMAMLVRTGQVRTPDLEGGVDLELIRAHRPRVPGARLAEAILEERREGR